MSHLSIVIPAYNEEGRIDVTLAKIYDFLKTKNYTYEVIVVDDGSSDRTAQVVSKSRLFMENKLKLIKNGMNMGKGYSVKNGILNSSGEYVLFSDADLSTPIEELDRLLEIIGKGYDIAIGSRSVADSSVIQHQPWYRELMGKAFNLFVKLLLINEFKDTQCGFKLFKGEPARQTARHMRINGFAFDVEMLCIARAKGYKVKETGIRWENSPESKVRIFRSPVSMFFDLIKIKLMHG